MSASTPEIGTRRQVALLISKQGPITAAEIASELDLTSPGVRRHLDAMADDGVVEVHESGAESNRRGRPARRYVLTDEGRRELSAKYDVLAVDALRFLAKTHGREAVQQFACERADGLAERLAPKVRNAGPELADKVKALADALTEEGYVASARTVSHPAALDAIQLCQGHCPVQHVAAEFPELCTSEIAVFSDLLGTPARRLATLVDGSHVCTTHITSVPTPQANVAKNATAAKIEAAHASHAETKATRAGSQEAHTHQTTPETLVETHQTPAKPQSPAAEVEGNR